MRNLYVLFRGCAKGCASQNHCSTTQCATYATYATFFYRNYKTNIYYIENVFTLFIVAWLRILSKNTTVNRTHVLNHEHTEVITIGRPRKTNTGAAGASDLHQVGEDIVRTNTNKPKRGAGNPAASRAGLITTDEDRQFVAGLLSETLHAYKQPRVRSDEELQERLNDYFQHCANTGQIPTVEEMTLFVGYSRAYLWDLETGRRKGFSDSTADIIKKAKEFLATFDAKLVVTGKMNFLAYCFRAKNYYGMVDKAEYVIAPSAQSESDYDEADLRRRYMVDGDSVVETEFTDD